MPPPTYVVLSRESALIALEGMSRSRDDHAVATYTAILHSLSESPNGGRSIRLPITNGLVPLLRSMHVRTGLIACVRSCRYAATYEHPEDPTVPPVVVRSYNRPRKRRTLDGPGGRRRYIRTSLTKEEHPMAARTTRTRAKSRKSAPPADELDDLEALEELEELDDIEEDEPAPKAKGRTRAKSRKAAEPEPEPEDDDDDDEDADDDGDEFDDMNIKELRAAAKEAGIKTTGMKADDIRDALRDEDDEDEPDEEDDEDDIEDEEPPKRKRAASRTSKAKAAPASKRSAAKPAAKAKGSTTSKKRTPPPASKGPRALASGKLSVTDVAEMAGTDGATLRQWLRRNGIEKDDETGRYEFTKKQAEQIVRKLNK